MKNGVLAYCFLFILCRRLNIPQTPFKPRLSPVILLTAPVGDSVPWLIACLLTLYAVDTVSNSSVNTSIQATCAREHMSNNCQGLLASLSGEVTQQKTFILGDISLL